MYKFYQFLISESVEKKRTYSLFNSNPSHTWRTTSYLTPGLPDTVSSLHSLIMLLLTKQHFQTQGISCHFQGITNTNFLHLIENLTQHYLHRHWNGFFNPQWLKNKKIHTNSNLKATITSNFTVNIHKHLQHA